MEINDSQVLSSKATLSEKGAIRIYRGHLRIGKSCICNLQFGVSDLWFATLKINR